MRAPLDLAALARELASQYEMTPMHSINWAIHETRQSPPPLATAILSALTAADAQGFARGIEAERIQAALKGPNHE